MKRQPGTVYHSARLALRLLVIWLAALGVGVQVAGAQQTAEPSPTADDEMFSSTIDSGFYDQGLDFFFRLHHHTKHYGEAAGKSSFAITKYFVRETNALFLDAAYRIDDNNNSTASTGVGLRTFQTEWFGGSPRVYGINFWYDGDHSKSDTKNYFNQISVGLESLGEIWDFRANAYFPLGDTKQDITRVVGGVGSLEFTGHQLTRSIDVLTDVAMQVYDVEAAYHFPQNDWANLWAFGGAYFLNGDDDRATGIRTGLRGYLTESLVAQLTYAHDDIFNTTVTFGFNWFFNPSTPSRTRMSPTNVLDRLRGLVRRNDYVVLNQKWDAQTQGLSDANGHLLYFVHADSNAAAGGTGTVEDPYSTLATTQAGSSNGDIVFVHSNSVFNNESFALQSNQQMLGEGVAGGHSVTTLQLGVVTLPESSPGAASGAVPIIQNAGAADAITLANNNTISGFTIDGGARAIVGAGSHSNVNINRSTIQNTTANGIDVNSTGNSTFDQLTFNSVGGDDLTLHDKNTGTTGTTTISKLTSNTPGGRGLNIEDNKGTITLSNYTYNGGAAGTGGVRFASNTGTVNATDVTIEDGTGVGLQISNSSGTFTFGSTTITDPGGIAFNVTGGSADVAFTGKITQTNNADTVNVSGGHTGTLTFTEATAGSGVVSATNGGGLYFNDADGTYTFASGVTLNGGDAGIDIVNDSAGTFTFNNATITNPDSTTAFNVSGGSANVAFTGKITQNESELAVNVSGGHTGTLTFTEATAGAGVVSSTNMGRGLRFQNADGTYTFASAVTLSGDSATINIIDDSDGTITFNNATITSPALTAFNVVGGSANVAFTGKITQGNNAGAVSVSGGHTGTLTFTEATAGAGVVSATNGDGLVFDNADGTYNFASGVTLNGGNAHINIVSDSAGTFTFNNATITDPNTSTAFNVSGGSANVAFTGKITQRESALAVNVSGGHTGTLTFTEATAGAGVVSNSNMGRGLRFMNADGTYTFASAVTLSGDSGTIDIIEDAGGQGSDGTITFNNATITSPTGTAFNVGGGSANVAFTGKITQANSADTVSVSGGHTGTITFTEATAGAGVVSATAGDGLQFNNADGTYTFASGVTLDGGDAGINIIGGSAGTFTFNDATITNPSVTHAFNVVGGSANVAFTGKITQNNNQRAVNVSGGHTGTLTFTEATAGAGVVEATNGNGLYFDNANGTYTFASGVTLNGGQAHIDIRGASTGTFTFNDATITSPTETAFNVAGGTANVAFTGKITQGTAGQRAVNISGGHTGTITFTEATVGAGVIEGTDGTGLEFNNADGTYTFASGVTLSGGSAGINIEGGSDGTLTFSDIDLSGGAAGVDIDSSDGTFTFSGGSITNRAGAAAAVGVNGGAATVNFNASIANDTDNSVEVTAITGGAVNFTGSITDTGTGLYVHDNTGGTVSFTGALDLDTTVNDAVTLTNNVDTTINFNQLDITTTTGDGFVASVAGTINVTGAGNTITTTNGGVGLNLANVTAGSGGVNFQSISVDGAGTTLSGIVLDTVDGGTVAIGAGGAAIGDGGTFSNMAGDVVKITNVENVSLNYLNITDSTGGDGIRVRHDNSDPSTVTLSHNNITSVDGQGIDFVVTSGAGKTTLTASSNTIIGTGQEGIKLDVADEADLTISANYVENYAAANNKALAFDATGTDAVKLLVTGNSFVNDSANATATIDATGAVQQLNATVTNNTLVNNGAGSECDITSNNAGARIRLNLNGNTADSGTGEFKLTNTAGTFSVLDLPNVGADNTGTVTPGGTLQNDLGPIPTP